LLELSVRIAFLADHMHLAATLAATHGRLWRHLYPQWGEAEALKDFRSHIARVAIPTTLVALDETQGQLLGSVSLLLDDLPGEPALNPWLANLHVFPAHRNQRIGKSLVAAIEKVAVSCAIDVLYLFTPSSEAFFASSKWQTIGSRECHGTRVTLMEKALWDAPATLPL
jgi:GNAT superfamily N-acetyltransferase